MSTCSLCRDTLKRLLVTSGRYWWIASVRTPRCFSNLLKSMSASKATRLWKLPDLIKRRSIATRGWTTSFCSKRSINSWERRSIASKYFCLKYMFGWANWWGSLSSWFPWQHRLFNIQFHSYSATLPSWNLSFHWRWKKARVTLTAESASWKDRSFVCKTLEVSSGAPNSK